VIKKHEAFLLFSLGVLIALSTTVNTMIAGVLNPLLASVKGSYV
jgi:hypothetical protein